MKSRTAPMLIDFQAGFENSVWGGRSVESVEAQAGHLLAAWHDAPAPAAHMRQVSPESDSPLQGESAAWLALRKAETQFEKSVNSACIGTGLEGGLSGKDFALLVVAGRTTPQCVSTTFRMVTKLEFEMTFAHDACAANSDRSWMMVPHEGMTPDMMRSAAISPLHGAFGTAQAVADSLA